MPCRDPRDDIDEEFEKAIIQFALSRFSDLELWNGIKGMNLNSSGLDFQEFVVNKRDYYRRLELSKRKSERVKAALAKLTKEEIEALGLEKKER